MMLPIQKIDTESYVNLIKLGYTKMITQENCLNLLVKLLEGMDIEQDKKDFYIELLYRL